MFFNLKIFLKFVVLRGNFVPPGIDNNNAINFNDNKIFKIFTS